MDKKIVFIPGWMYSAEYFKLGEGINIWQEDFDFSQTLDCDCFIGHSMGAAVALKIWCSNKDKKLILVDPFLEQKSIFRTFINWLKFARHESIANEGRLGLRYLPRNIKKLFKFPDEDYWEILKNIPKEKIKILHGEKDLFLCGRDICVKFQELGYEVIEVPEAGHDWHKNFDDIIREIINN